MTAGISPSEDTHPCSCWHSGSGALTVGTASTTQPGHQAGRGKGLVAGPTGCWSSISAVQSSCSTILNLGSFANPLWDCLHLGQHLFHD